MTIPGNETLINFHDTIFYIQNISYRTKLNCIPFNSKWSQHAFLCVWCEKDAEITLSINIYLFYVFSFCTCCEVSRYLSVILQQKYINLIFKYKLSTRWLWACKVCKTGEENAAKRMNFLSEEWLPYTHPLPVTSHYDTSCFGDCIMYSLCYMLCTTSNCYLSLNKPVFIINLYNFYL